MTTSIPHGATAERPVWDDLPPAVQSWIEVRLDGRVMSASSAGGGFTWGFASVLHSDRSTAFVKAAPPENPVIAASYRREAEIVPLLPAAAGAPEVLWHGEVAGWTVVGFEAVEGRAPRRPWNVDELGRVVQATTDAAVALSVPPEGLTLEPVSSFDGEFGSWRAWAAGAGIPAEHSVARAAAMAADHLDELASLESGWVEATAGESALHFDLRDDNVILATDGRVHLCDWNWLVVGAPWLDLVGLLISVHGDGLPVAPILATNPLTRHVDPEDVDRFLAALAGYFTRAAATPLDFRASRWLRPHQAWYRDATLDLLARRRGWDR